MCIDHLTIWDYRQLSLQIRGILGLPTAFIDQKGVLGSILLPILTEEAKARPTDMTPRVPAFRYPIPDHTMEKWRLRVTVDSSAAISLSTAMAR